MPINEQAPAMNDAAETNGGRQARDKEDYFDTSLVD